MQLNFKKGVGLPVWKIENKNLASTKFCLLVHAVNNHNKPNVGTIM
jgi:hypothetical protein